MRFNVPFSKGSYHAYFFYQIDGVRFQHKLLFLITSELNLIYYEKTVLFDSVSHRVDYYDLGSPITFCVFNGAKTSLKSKPFGVDFLIKKGYNVVSTSHEDNQYQSLSFDEYKEIVNPVVNNKKVFLYGSSLGGYCAVYYAGAVNGTVIASAPRNSAHPYLIENYASAVDYKSYPFRHLEFNDNKLTSNKVYCFFDPGVGIDSDFINQILLSSYPDAKLIEVNFAGHETLFHLNYTGQLEYLIDCIVMDCSDGLNVDQTKNSFYSDLNRARAAFKKNKYKECLFYADRGLSYKGVTQKYKLAFNKLKNKSAGFVYKDHPRRNVRLKEHRRMARKLMYPVESTLRYSDGSLENIEYELCSDSKGFIETGASFDRNKKTLYFTGDSFVESSLSGTSSRFVAQVANRCKDLNVFNSGYSGTTSLQAFLMIISKLPYFMKPGDWIVFFVPQSDANAFQHHGGYWNNNKTFTPINNLYDKAVHDYSGNALEALLKSLKSFLDCISVNFAIVVSPYKRVDFAKEGWVADYYKGDVKVFNKSQERRRNICDQASKAAKEINVPLLDLDFLMQDKPYAFYDQLHLNSEGQNIVSNIMYDYISSLFPK